MRPAASSPGRPGRRRSRAGGAASRRGANEWTSSAARPSRHRMGLPPRFLPGSTIRGFTVSREARPGPSSRGRRRGMLKVLTLEITRRFTMPEERIATVRPVEEPAATGVVAAIFADIKKTKNIDFVPAFWRVIATNPVQLELVWTNLKTLMHPEAAGRAARLDPATREIIALAV